MVGDGRKIIHAPWRIFRHLTGWDLQKIRELERIYTFPEQRKDIFTTLQHQHHCRQIISINSEHGNPIHFDAIYARKPRNDGLYYIFLHLMDINSE